MILLDHFRGALEEDLAVSHDHDRLAEGHHHVHVVLDDEKGQAVGVQGVDPVLINTARTFGYGRFAVLRKVILPAALPLIFAGLRVSLALGLILVVIAEMLAGTGGLGYLILDMQRTFRVQDMYAWLAILAVLGYALNALFLALEHRLIHWAAARPE